MARRMLDVRDRSDNQILRQISGVRGILVVIRESKIRWAEHIVLLASNRWAPRLAE